jgi:hypothetical protein
MLVFAMNIVLRFFDLSWIAWNVNKNVSSYVTLPTPLAKLWGLIYIYIYIYMYKSEMVVAQEEVSLKCYNVHEWRLRIEILAADCICCIFCLIYRRIYSSVLGISQDKSVKGPKQRYVTIWPFIQRSPVCCRPYSAEWHHDHWIMNTEMWNATFVA